MGNLINAFAVWQFHAWCFKTSKKCSKTNNMIPLYMMQVAHIDCHLKSTLKFHTNQPISGLIERDSLRPNFKIHNFAFEKNAFFAFAKELHRAILTERTDIHNIMLATSFLRNSGIEKLKKKRPCITKVSYFADGNNLALRIQWRQWRNCSGFVW